MKENWLKLHEIVVQFPKFIDIWEIGHVEVKFEVEFYNGSSLMAVSCALKVAKMAQNPAKTQIMDEPGRGELNCVQY